ncbi:MAG: hypothetical protein V3U65_18505 [Granulosicoccaceae bacterium]
MAVAANPKSDTLEKPWIQSLSAVLDLTDRNSNPRLRTTMSCNVKQNRIAFFLPPEMAALQPENLRYMHRIAKKHNSSLIEDRRSVNVQPILEQRNVDTDAMALGISMLLKQAGMPGAAPEPSAPHRLHPDNLHIDIAELISMASFAAPTSKKIVLLPNQFMVDVLDNETNPIVGYACKLVTAEAVTTLAYFDSSHFHAVAYHAGSQFVVHVFLAGGPLHSPQIWSKPNTISNDSFRFQLFKSTHPGHDFGLMYKTLYLDVNDIDENETEAKPTKSARARAKDKKDANTKG